jgi:hypothetical protein
VSSKLKLVDAERLRSWIRCFCETILPRPLIADFDRSILRAVDVRGGVGRPGDNQSGGTTSPNSTTAEPSNCGQAKERFKKESGDAGENTALFVG